MRAESVSRRLRVAASVAAAILVAVSAVVVRPQPVAAGLYGPVPADQNGDPTDTFRSDDALFVFAVSDIKGGRVCVVPPTGALAGLSCDAPAWGEPNTLVGIGTVYSLMEGPYLRVGSWRLLTETIPVDPGEEAVPLAVSDVFTVSPCDQTCDPTIAQAVVDEFKTTTLAQWEGYYDACTAMVLVSAAKGMNSAFHDAISGKLLTDALQEKLKLDKSYTWDYGSVTLELTINGANITVVPLDETAHIAEKKATEILQKLVCTLGAAYADLANDPPDPLYLDVEAPTTRPVPDLASATANALGADMDQELGTGMAVLTALERYQAANAASDSNGVHRQTAALADYGLDLVDNTRATAAALRTYATSLDAVSEFATPIFADQADFDRVQGVYDRIKMIGFTSTELADMQSIGMTPDEIASLREEFDMDFTGLVPGKTYQDTLRSIADTLDANSFGLERFARAAAAVSDATDVPPSAGFTPSPATGARPLDVTFDNTSTDPGNDLLTSHWDFGDGTTSTAVSPVHTYVDAGDYLVRLDVSDGRFPAFDQQVIHVTPPGTPPVARFALPRYTYLTGDTINVTDESTDAEGPIASRHWFGSANFSDLTGAATDITFPGAGITPIMLQVTDEDGWTRETQHTATVFDAIPVPHAHDCPGPAVGSTRDSAGRDFFLLFEQNLEFRGALSLNIASPTSTTGTVEIPGLGFDTPFSVTPGAVTTIDIPSGAMARDSDLVSTQGIRVCAQDEVTVYGTNAGGSTTDTFLGIPVDALGTQYVVMSIGADLGHFQSVTNERSQFAVAATEDDTVLEITPAISVGGHPAGVPFNVDLGRYMTFQLRADNDREDLTGSIIRSNHPVAVFSGDSSRTSRTVSSLPPPDRATAAGEHVGRDFVFASLEGRTAGDVVRVVAALAGTVVELDGSTVGALEPASSRSSRSRPRRPTRSTRRSPFSSPSSRRAWPPRTMGSAIR